MACGIQSNEKIVRISNYAKRLLAGSSLEEIANEDGITLEEARRVISEIESINPCLYIQLKSKL